MKTVFGWGGRERSRCPFPGVPVEPLQVGPVEFFAEQVLEPVEVGGVARLCREVSHLLRIGNDVEKEKLIAGRFVNELEAVAENHPRGVSFFTVFAVDVRAGDCAEGRLSVQVRRNGK
jgi:hypothetical protein